MQDTTMFDVSGASIASTCVCIDPFGRHTYISSQHSKRHGSWLMPNPTCRQQHERPTTNPLISQDRQCNQELW